MTSYCGDPAVVFDVGYQADRNSEFQNYKIEDSGTYICNIKNEAGEAEVKLTMNIEGPTDDESDDESEA
ncbi:hypothetical protein OESDEN_15226 [Oesophagostomum dentatum]|uniref:Immunoglobulin I-set domain-containing protein n=1 Tax=Oesophagostomum dentatum TaxID=61180 RepID=A0A0B1SI91_OESDE|nr:hypothetical protein OESDEN_15226 [Oesophagostomum dentatum]